MSAFDRWNWAYVQIMVALHLPFFRFGMRVRSMPRGVRRSLLYPFGITSATLSSVSFSLLCGIVLFGEWRLMFTWLVQHVIDTHDPQRDTWQLAYMIATDVINPIDPGHIKGI